MPIDNFSEEIEIFGVRVTRVAKALARFAAAHPAIFDPAEAAFVVAHRPRRTLPIAEDPFVKND